MLMMCSPRAQAFEEEKQRRIAAEQGMPAPARSMAQGASKAPPPSHPSLHGHQRTQALLRENDALKAELRATDGTLREKLEARLKSYQVISLTEHQDALMEEIKVRNAEGARAEQTIRGLRGEIDKLQAKLEGETAAGKKLAEEKEDLEAKLETIRGHL